MSNNKDRIDRLLGLIDQPGPPAALRERTLSTAVQAMRESADRPDAWTSIWESRRLRLAWAVTVIVLLAANMLLPSRFAGKQQHETAGGNRLEMEELGDAARVPRLRFSYIQPAIGAPSTQKEKL